MKEKITVRYSKINKDASVGSNRKNAISVNPKRTKPTKKTARKGCGGCSRR